MKKAKLQRIEREHGGGLFHDMVFAALWDWYKSTTRSGNKAGYYTTISIFEKSGRRLT
jgi:hypothetical protein